jgi:uncharacterized membrane protein YjjP (DUF1212 family)
MKQQPYRSNWMVFRWPLLLAAFSIVGLVCALVADGWADVLSWLLLGGILIVIAVAWFHKPFQE